MGYQQSQYTRAPYYVEPRKPKRYRRSKEGSMEQFIVWVQESGVSVVPKPTSLEEWQQKVGGFIEFVQINKKLCAYVNEEGRLKHLPILATLPKVGPVYGPIALFLEIDHEGESVGFTKEKAIEVAYLFMPAG